MERRTIAQPKIASLIKRLALTKEQILALPDPLAATIESGEFAEAHDPADPFKPFLPPDLNSSTTSSWICLGEEGHEIPAGLHTGQRYRRSMFLQFMRLPGGRAETLQYMERISKRPHQFPVGTQFALLEQPMLISKGGELVLSPLVVSVQLRAYLDVGRDFQRHADAPKATQCVAEFVMQPRQLMKGNAAMRAMGLDDFHFDAGAETATPGFSPRDPFATGKISEGMPPKRLNQCMDCHSRAGGLGVRTRSFKSTNYYFTEGTREAIANATASLKREHDEYTALKKYWHGEPVVLPKPMTQTEPRTKPEHKPDRFPDTPELRAALFTRVEAEVAKELKALHTAVLLAEAARLSEMFGLEEDERAQLGVAAREAAGSAVEKVRDSIQGSFRSSADYILNKDELVDGSKNDIDLTAFTLNGRFITLNAAAGDQDVGERNSYDSLDFNLTRRVFDDWLSVGYRFGSFSGTVGPEDADVQREELWQRALSAVLTQEQAAQYSEQAANRLKTAMVDMILTALQFDLDLPDSQLPVVRRRVEERVVLESPSRWDIERTAGRELQRLKAEDLGDILSDEQLNRFPEHPESRIKSTIITLILTELQFALRLPDSQLPVVRKRLEERLNPGPLKRSIGSTAMRLRWGLKEKDVAGVLTGPQLTLWRLTQEQH